MHTVVALQEVPRWLPAVAAKSKHLLLTSSTSDCAILLLKFWELLIKKVIIGSYWVAVVVGKYVFLSAHLLWDRPAETVPDGRVAAPALAVAEAVLNEFNDFKLI